MFSLCWSRNFRASHLKSINNYLDRFKVYIVCYHVIAMLCLFEIFDPAVVKFMSYDKGHPKIYILDRES